jgi:PAS domain S-box-containing protein
MPSKSNPPLPAPGLRARAEQRLHTQAFAPDDIQSTADAHRIVHELQVHQVELEMQNAELQQSREHAEALLVKYTDLYDLAPIGYFSLDAHGRILHINLTASSLFGVERSFLRQRKLIGRVAPSSQSLLAAALQRIFSGVARESCVLRLAHNGRDMHLDLESTPGLAECRVVMMDITEQRHAENKLQLSEVRYRRLFEAAHDGVLLLDPVTRKITDANPFMTEMLGYTHDQLIGMELFEIGLLKDETASQEMVRKLKRKHEVRYEDLPLESKHGRHQEVEVVANLYEENGQPVIQCNIRDITARKLAEEHLRQSETRFRMLFELGPIAVYSCDATGLIQDFNKRAVELWGRRPARGARSERFCGSFKLYQPGGRFMRHAQCPMADVLAGKLAEARDQEVIIERPDRSRITCIVNIRALHDAQGVITGAINCFYDITERKRADAVQQRIALLALQNERAHEEIDRRREAEKLLRVSEQNQRHLLGESQELHAQLRHLTRQIIVVQEEERKAISRALHDDVMQTLVGINLELTLLSQHAARNTGNLKAKVARTQRLVKKSLKSVHRFARDLRPTVLDDFGLIPALHTYVKTLPRPKSLAIHVRADERVETLGSATRAVLFRVAQEALKNVIRHARATTALVRISRRARSVRMEINDNGRAFAVDQILNAKNPKRLGLVGMKERIEMIGGTLTIQSVRGKGTTVRADFPLARG